MSNYFSTNLKFLREQKGYSRNKLANIVGVNQTTIARWENEEMAPSIDNAEEISRVLNIDLPDLLRKDLRMIDTSHNDDVYIQKADSTTTLFEDFSKIDKFLIELSEEQKKAILFLIKGKEKKLKKGSFLSSNLKYLRTTYKKTQTDIAKICGKTNTAICNWEKGIRDPEILDLLALSNFFNISIDDMIKIDLKNNY